MNKNNFVINICKNISIDTQGKTGERQMMFKSSFPVHEMSQLNMCKHIMIKS